MWLASVALGANSGLLALGGLPLEVGLSAGAVAVVLILVLGPLGLTRRQVGVASAAVLILTVAGLVFFGAAIARRSDSQAALASAVPVIGSPDEAFVTSDSCRSCHPSNYASWHRSYHRTMTQTATPQVVVGNFDNVRLESRGRSYHLTRRGDEFWVKMVDPDWEHERIDEGVYPNLAPDPPRLEKRIVMTTGSHHMQTYWVASRVDGRLFNLPFVWLNEDQRWAPREDVFLRPPDFPRQFGTWHNNCIECHAVAGEQEYNKQAKTYEPMVAELGIACEACHGPAQDHVRVNRDPRRRYQYRLGDEVDPTIVNPEHLSAASSSQVCGQCHGMNIFKVRELREGVRYRAGGDLLETRIILRANDTDLAENELATWPRLQRHIERELPSFLDERFWSDGMVRVSGREHNAMTASACFNNGTLSCLSCHSMHDSAPNDMLAQSMDSDTACLQCHELYGDRLEEHTHHAPGSAGSACYNCHMPHTTYGLLTAIRSHQIDSPSVANSVETGRPNACNLCHLDQTLRWSANHLTRWYDQGEVQLTQEQETIAAAVLWALTGDAGQRALIAWHMGWTPAKQASGQDWMAPYLGHLLVDPYACVRYIAHRSLRRVEGFESFVYDFVGSANHRSEARRRALVAWLNVRPEALDRTGSRLLLSENGQLNAAELTRLSKQRDDRPVDLRE